MENKIEVIQNEIIEKLLPTCQLLRDNGFNDLEIKKWVIDHNKKKSFDFYKHGNLNLMQNILGVVIGELKNADSKIEKIVYQLFLDNKIDFKFQVKIGFYWADFLLWGFLIVEIDGPQHENQKIHDNTRDNYLKRMGYKILRIPTWVLVNEPEKIIELVLSYKPKERVRKNRLKPQPKEVTP
jgi:very-short-patch-repair endonuclease